MTIIVTRIGKGSSLSYEEMDSNFTNLNTDKLEVNSPASDIANTPAGSISATTVQAALNELDTDKAPIASPVFTGTVTSPTNYNVSGSYGALQVSGVDTMRFGSDVSGQLAGGRNRFINSNFKINQGGVSGTVVLTAGQYGHDGWKAGAAGCTYTFATVSNVTTVTISSGSLIQVVDGAFIQTGLYTVSWSGTSQCKFWTNSFTTSPHTGTLVGGTNAPMEFSTGTLILPQIEFGSIASAREFRDDELARCMYYHEQTLGFGFSKIVYVLNTGTIQGFSFMTPKRVAPTVTIYTRNGVINLVTNTSNGADAGGAGCVASGITTYGVFAITDAASPFGGISSVDFLYTASARL